nr:IS110 family transposase [Streptomyces sp. SID1034]
MITAGDNPDRLRSEASFAHLCAAAPVPASSGRTNRHRINRGGDRNANSALSTIILVRMRTRMNGHGTMWPDALPRACPPRTSCGVSRGSSPARSTGTS